MRTLVIIVILIGTMAAISFSSAPALKLQAFTLSRSEAPGGITVIGTLTLSRSAPKQGATVMIDAIDPAIASAPTAVQFTQGQSVKSFTIIGVPRCDHAQVDVRCSLGVALIQTLVIREPAFALSFAPNPVVGGNETIGTVTLDGPAPDCP